MTVAAYPEAANSIHMVDDVRDIPGVWWALYLPPGKGAFEIERRYENELKAIDVQCYLPLCQVRRVRKGVLQDWVRPLFPGYIFVAVDGDADEQAARLYEARTRTFAVRPQPIQCYDQESLLETLSRIQEAERADMLHESYDDFQPGRKVRVIAGPFMGMEAWVDKREENKAQITLNITVLGASREMEINPELLELW